MFPARLTTLFTALALASQAESTGLNQKFCPVSGDNQNISIYTFERATCGAILRRYGACGLLTHMPELDQQVSFVAMPSSVFDKYGAGNKNTLCGKTITITVNGVTKTAVVADRNLSNDNSIDTCPEIWEAFGGHDRDGTLIRGASWSICEA
ncbi:hypothetical protein PWT90_10502 [Aphanocladium album]|nr:hypothetical protein PWT90_10502 [Aphanocladium album]